MGGGIMNRAPADYAQQERAAIIAEPRRVRLPTGSALGRAVECTASCTLPCAQDTNAQTLGGTSNHSVIEVGITSGNIAGLPAVVAECIGNGAVVAVERTYALDMLRGTARVMGDRLGRDYAGLRGDEMALTVDLVVRLPSGRIRVVDWKSRERAAPVRENWQMRAAAIAAWSAEERADVTLEIVLAYLNDGETDGCEVDALDVATWAGEVAALHRRLHEYDSAARIHSGPWCKYCPSLAWCPQQTRLAQAMVGELADIEGGVAVMTDEQAGRAWEKLKAFGALADKVETALRMRARHSPLPLSNGRRLALVEQRGRESVDAAAVKARYAEWGEAVPMKRGAPFEVVKELKKEEA